MCVGMLMLLLRFVGAESRFRGAFLYWLFPTSTIYFCSVVQQLFRFRLLLITHIVRTLFLHFSVTYAQISDFCIFFWFLVVFVLKFSKYYELGLITVYVSIICNDFSLRFKSFTKNGVTTYKTVDSCVCVFWVFVVVWFVVCLRCKLLLRFASNCLLCKFVFVPFTNIFRLLNFTNCFVYFVCLLTLRCSFSCFVLLCLLNHNLS